MRKAGIRRFAMVALCALAPILQGGCPEFRNSVLDAADTATRDLIFGRQPPGTAVQTALDGVLNAALDLFFDHFRSNSSSTLTGSR